MQIHFHSLSLIIFTKGADIFGHVSHTFDMAIFMK